MEPTLLPRVWVLGLCLDGDPEACLIPIRDGAGVNPLCSIGTLGGCHPPLGGSERETGDLSSPLQTLSPKGSCFDRSKAWARGPVLGGWGGWAGGVTTAQEYRTSLDNKEEHSVISSGGADVSRRGWETWGGAVEGAHVNGTPGSRGEYITRKQASQ